MIGQRTFILSISLLAAAALVYAAPDPLDPIFARIDAAAKTFKGMTADISDTEHHAIVPDQDDVSTGAIKLLRVKSGSIRLLASLKGTAGAQTYALDGSEGRTYNDKTHVLDVYDLASRQAMINQYLLLGFGVTSAELKSTYAVTWVGEEQIAGQPTSHLKLIPKSAETLHTLRQVDLWYSANGVVMRQKLLYADGDYKLVTYSNMKLGAMPEKDLDLKPKGATVQKH